MSVVAYLKILVGLDMCGFIHMIDESIDKIRQHQVAPISFQTMCCSPYVLDM